MDFVSEDLRRLIVNAAYHLTGQEVPTKADVAFVDPFYPSFYGFIQVKNYWKDAGLKLEDLGLGRTPHLPDPKGSPATKKAKTKGTSGNAKPNSSGELCWKYHQTGECTFKGKCIHKHVPPGDDTDGDDDRE